MPHPVSIRPIALLLSLVLALAACGGAEPADPSTTVTAPEAVPTITVADGFRLPVGFDLEGHRGARGMKPENTLPAFETGLDLGVTTLELDLHFSADGEVVIWHDPTIDPSKCRLADDAPGGVPDPDTAASDELAIRALTVEQLAGYRCDRNPDPERFPDQDPAPTFLAGDDYRIVPLGDLFDFVDRYAASEDKSLLQRAGARRVAFNVETKRDPRDPEAIGDGFDGETVGPFEQRLLAVVDEHGVHDRVTVQSFDVRSLRAIDAVDPSIRLSVLTAVPHAALPAFTAGRSVVWSPKSSTVDGASVDAAHEAGHTVVPWTVDDLDEAARLLGLGVDGLITDRPDRFVSR